MQTSSGASVSYSGQFAAGQGAGAALLRRAHPAGCHRCGHSAGKPTVSHTRAHRSPSEATPAPSGQEPSQALPTPPRNHPPPRATEAGVCTRGQPDQRYPLTTSALDTYSHNAILSLSRYFLSRFAGLIQLFRVLGTVFYLCKVELFYDEDFYHVALWQLSTHSMYEYINC